MSCPIGDAICARKAKVQAGGGGPRRRRSRRMAGGCSKRARTSGLPSRRHDLREAARVGRGGGGEVGITPRGRRRSSRPPGSRGPGLPSFRIRDVLAAAPRFTTDRAAMPAVWEPTGCHRVSWNRESIRSGCRFVRCSEHAKAIGQILGGSGETVRGQARRQIQGGPHVHDDAVVGVSQSTPDETGPGILYDFLSLFTHHASIGLNLQSLLLMGHI